jgi:hypothetical protein
MAPYLALMKEDAPQREHSLRKVFNGLLDVVLHPLLPPYDLLNRSSAVERYDGSTEPYGYNAVAETPLDQPRETLDTASAR